MTLAAHIFNYVTTKLLICTFVPCLNTIMSVKHKLFHTIERLLKRRLQYDKRGWFTLTYFLSVLACDKHVFRNMHKIPYIILYTKWYLLFS